MLDVKADFRKLTEQSVLGLLKTYPESAPDVFRFVEMQDFEPGPRQRIFRAICELYGERIPIDSVTIGQRLTRYEDYDPELDSVELVGLPVSTQSGTTVARVLMELGVRSRLAVKLREKVTQLEDRTTDTAEVMEEIRGAVQAESGRFESGSTKHISQTVVDAVEAIERLRKGETAMKGHFRFKAIDDKTGGMDEGNLVVIAGEHKSGKTTLALQIAMRNAEHGLPVQIFSQEMTAKEIVMRYAVIRSGINYLEAIRHRLSLAQWERWKDAVHEISAWPVFLNDRMNTIGAIRNEAEVWKRAEDIGMVVVDYIQIVKAEGNFDTREREVASLSSGLKMLAKDLKIPVIALTQVNKDMRARESRAIEQDMDKGITIEPQTSQGEIDEQGNRLVKMALLQRMGVSGDFGIIEMNYDVRVGAFADREAFAAAQTTLPM